MKYLGKNNKVKIKGMNGGGGGGGGSQTPATLPPYSLLFAFLNFFLLLPPSLLTPQLRAPPVHPLNI